MSGLVYVELKGEYISQNGLRGIIYFFEQNNVEYIYSGYLSVSIYDSDGDIDHINIPKSKVLNNENNIYTIFSTFLIDGEKYSLGFSPISNDKLTISFDSYKKLNTNFADFTWIYNSFLEKIGKKLFCFENIVYHNYSY